MCMCMDARGWARAVRLPALDTHMYSSGRGEAMAIRRPPWRRALALTPERCTRKTTQPDVTGMGASGGQVQVLRRPDPCQACTRGTHGLHTAHWYDQVRPSGYTGTAVDQRVAPKLSRRPPLQFTSALRRCSLQYEHYLQLFAELLAIFLAVVFAVERFTVVDRWRIMDYQRLFFCAWVYPGTWLGMPGKWSHVVDAT